MNRTAKTSIVIIDISCFTKLVKATSSANSARIVRQLLQAIIEENRLALDISDIEGDAILISQNGKCDDEWIFLQLFLEVGVLCKVIKPYINMKYLVTGLSVYFLLALVGCTKDAPGPQAADNQPIFTDKLISRDSITAGNYRGIAIGSSTDESFSILEHYRQQEVVTYLGAVNNYFFDVTDLKNRIRKFTELVLDEKFDTESGVQLQLDSGQVKHIALNNRWELSQWPETTEVTKAIQIGDQADVLYNKLLALSKQREYAHKFERMVLLARHTYAIYDPAKASLPRNIIYRAQANQYEDVTIHLKDKKVHYITVNRFEEQ